MSHTPDILHAYTGNLCELKLVIEKPALNLGRTIQNVRNCDVFMGEHDFYIYLDVRLFKFHASRRLNVRDLRIVHIVYNTKHHALRIVLPCYPRSDETIDDKDTSSNSLDRPVDMWKLKRITNICFFMINTNPVLLTPMSSFEYGFASKYRGRINGFGCHLENIVQVLEPESVSPLQRTVDRETEEMKSFSREQYEANFVELQIPDGQDNPMLFTFNFKDSELDSDEEILLHNLTSKAELNKMPDEYDITEIDYGLISMLMATCYDERFTSSTPNCESAWTRTMLSATLSYFEPFTSLKEVVISFMRRSLIYPLYRNYDLGRKCVEDCVNAITSPRWIIKQLLISHELFETSERAVLNYYYVDDYIRYLSNAELCSPVHLQMLANNLKNVLLDISKKQLGLGLKDLEAELLQDLISDIQASSATSDELDEDDDSESEDECTTDSSEESTTGSSEDSVIELKLNDSNEMFE